ncbi:MAG: FumA C-terminus/TtdB family hydratase beta subunit [Clostridia bacterium]
MIINKLVAGQRVLLSGVIYTARDQAHKRIAESLFNEKKPPFDLIGQAIYYVGPAPAKPGEIIGSAGPTTSGRMDVYTPLMLENGIRVLIGKGKRNQDVKAALLKTGSVYLAAYGGAGALLANSIKKADIIAYEDLGPEAIYRLEVEDFPVIVIIDILGNDYYEQVEEHRNA